MKKAKPKPPRRPVPPATPAKNPVTVAIQGGFLFPTPPVWLTQTACIYPRKRTATCPHSLENCYT